MAYLRRSTKPHPVRNSHMVSDIGIRVVTTQFPPWTSKLYLISSSQDSTGSSYSPKRFVAHNPMMDLPGTFCDLPSQICDFLCSWISLTANKKIVINQFKPGLQFLSELNIPSSTAMSKLLPDRCCSENPANNKIMWWYVTPTDIRTCKVDDAYADDATIAVTKTLF